MKKFMSSALAAMLTLSTGVVAFADPATAGEIDFGEVKTVAYGEQITVEFTYADDFEFDDYSASVKLGGQYVDKYSLEEVSAEDGTAALHVKFKKLPLAYESEVEIQVKATTSSGATITTSSGVAQFTVMDEAISEETIEAHVENELTIPVGSALVVTDDGFATAGANPLSLDFGEFQIDFSKGTNQKGINFDSNSVAIDEIVDKYDDQEYKFLSFTSPVKLANRATVTMDFDAYDEEAFGFKADAEEKIVYLYQYDGKNIISHGTVDLASKNANVSFTVKAGESLGRYFVTNEAITGSVSGSTNNGSNNGSNNNTTEDNPNTGANDFVGLAGALGLISLVSAAAIALKKKQ